MEIKLGVVGTGLIFDQYVNAAKWMNENAGAKITFVAAVNRTQAGNERAAGYGIERTYNQIEAMMESERLDGVLVLVPPAEMCRVALALMPFGVPMMIEKPPGISVKEAEAIAAQSRIYQTSVMVAFNRRFYSVVEQAKNIIQFSGPLLGMRMDGFERFRAYRESGMDQSKLDHLLTYNTIHCIDLIRQYAGNIEQVHAFRNTGVAEPSNHRYSALIVSERNIPVTFQSYWHAFGNWNYELYVPDGKISFVNLEEAYYHRRTGETVRLVPARHDVEAKAGFVDQFNYFFAIIEGKAYYEGEMSIHDAIRTMELVNEIEA